MKVVLAKPCWDYPKGKRESTYNRVWAPLGLANCAAVLNEAGHETAIIDAHALGLSPQELANRARGAELVILTSTGLDRWQCPYNDARPFLEAARALVQAGIKTIATGFHSTIDPEAVIAATGVDACIRGEPEGVVGRIAEGADFADIDGLAFKRDGRVVVNAEAAPVDLASLPVPAFESLEVQKYFYEILGRNFLLIETTRGCPYRCTFCSKVMYGDTFRKKRPEQVCTEIDAALEKTDVETAYFIDLEFTVARELAEEVCRHLIARGTPLRWCCQTRADNIDKELVSLMREAGCDLVHLGVESGSARILAESGKATTREAILEGARTIQAAGIETLAFFMFGLPGETDGEREETIEFAVELDPTYASFHFATPYPGSGLFAQAGYSMADDLSFPLVMPGEDLALLQKWVRKAMRRFYLRPSYVTRHILKGRPSDWLRQMRLFLSYLR